MLGAAVAAQVALVAAPTAMHGDASIWLFVTGGLGAFAAILGLLRVSAPLLLVGAPLGWAIPGYWLPVSAFEGAGLALGVVAVYLIVCLWWLRAMRRAEAERAEPAWSALITDDAPGPRAGRDPLPWIAALLVAGPAVGVGAWPPLARALDGGFPGRTGQAGALLALVGTLIGLAMVTDLARGRHPTPGSRQRALLLGVVFGLLMLLYWVTR